MELAALLKILGRFSKADFGYLFERWPLLSETDLKQENCDSLTKRDISEAISRLHKKRTCSSSVVAELDLLFLQRYSHRRLWKVFRLHCIKKRKIAYDVDAFEQAIADQMGLYFDGEVTVSEVNGLFWVRLLLKKKGRRKNGTGLTTTNVVYVVHPKNTLYCLTSGLTQGLKERALQVFMAVLRGDHFKPALLSGRHISSLLQLIVNKHSKRPPEFTGQKEKENLPDNVYNENHLQKRKRDDFVDSNFGPNKQPRLETVEYKLETKLRAKESLPTLSQDADDNPTFRCKVTFSGPSVLEGLKNLAAAGLAKVPMKEHLGQVHLKAQNVFLIKQKESSGASS